MNAVVNLKTTSARATLSDEILSALARAVRPLTLSDLYEQCETAEDRPAIARVLTYLKSENAIENGPDVAPGEPGGMEGKGARAVASYRLAPESAYPEHTPEEFAQAKRSASAPIMEAAREPLATEDSIALLAALEAEIGTAAAPVPQWEPDAGRTPEPADEMLVLLDGHDELMILYADKQFADDPIWALMKAQRTAMMMIL